MISFGFTIYKFFEFEQRGMPVRRGILTPRGFALIMVSIGIMALLLATISHRREIQTLKSDGERRWLVEIVAAMIIVFGLMVLLSAIFNG